MKIQIILINNTRRMLKARGLTLVCHRVARRTTKKSIHRNVPRKKEARHFQ